jgi:hypothetical protein
VGRGRSRQAEGYGNQCEESVHKLNAGQKAKIKREKSIESGMME